MRKLNRGHSTVVTHWVNAAIMPPAIGRLSPRRCLPAAPFQFDRGRCHFVIQPTNAAIVAVGQTKLVTRNHGAGSGAPGQRASDAQSITAEGTT